MYFLISIDDVNEGIFLVSILINSRILYDLSELEIGTLPNGVIKGKILKRPLILKHKPTLPENTFRIRNYTKFSISTTDNIKGVDGIKKEIQKWNNDIITHDMIENIQEYFRITGNFGPGIRTDIRFVIDNTVSYSGYQPERVNYVNRVIEIDRNFKKNPIARLYIMQRNTQINHIQILLMENPNEEYNMMFFILTSGQPRFIMKTIQQICGIFHFPESNIVYSPYEHERTEDFFKNIYNKVLNM